MKVFFHISVIIVYLSLTYAAAFYGIQEHQDHPGKCYDHRYGTGLYAPGEEINDPLQCLLIKCHEGSIIESYSCGLFPKREGCILSDAPIAPYPNCCNRKLICSN
uniref:Single domain-containing protein n=1 Tax=Stomoxys calcitrans TaxID=35570 RepID=A0A1I8PAQ8_STOCA